MMEVLMLLFHLWRGLLNWLWCVHLVWSGLVSAYIQLQMHARVAQIESAVSDSHQCLVSKVENYSDKRILGSTSELNSKGIMCMGWSRRRWVIQVLEDIKKSGKKLKRNWKWKIVGRKKRFYTFHPLTLEKWKQCYKKKGYSKPKKKTTI